ncbi:unnamed protein product [Gongylonema pulchrum]|uniref:Adenosine 5'-monophosphoramidase HINT3 n=1 Tax=Gongylonema pulchrum TaxID=637853 RepID=A0A183EA73_9BILA|nr:unnamed protein product [Gongylonema pulchrum]
MWVAVQGCRFCSIVNNQPEKHLRESDNAVVVEDAYPHAPHHYLILSKRHINKASDLTTADLPLVKEMDRLGRDYLRETLKQRGEADTVEDLLRMGFHWSMFVSVHHLHMHLLYPTRDVCFISSELIQHSGNDRNSNSFFFCSWSKNIILNLL